MGLVNKYIIIIQFGFSKGLLSIYVSLLSKILNFEIWGWVYLVNGLMSSLLGSNIPTQFKN